MKAPKIKMIDTLISKIPESQLETWLWWLSFAVIVVPAVFGLLLAGLSIAALRVNDRLGDVKTAIETKRAKEAEEKEHIAIKERNAIKAELATTKASTEEARQLALKAEEASRPKTLKERVLDCIDAGGANPAYKEHLRSTGQPAILAGNVPLWEYDALKKMSMEPNAALYFMMRDVQGFTGIEANGVPVSGVHNVEITVYPDLIR
ncbi:MAG: hypothetical protein P4L99_15510 [Chthoniobacter sp.]|nr:hypothetical protein [Chthoniobacter sp.]